MASQLVNMPPNYYYYFSFPSTFSQPIFFSTVGPGGAGQARIKVGVSPIDTVNRSLSPVWTFHLALNSSMLTLGQLSLASLRGR